MTFRAFALILTLLAAAPPRTSAETPTHGPQADDAGHSTPHVAAIPSEETDPPPEPPRPKRGRQGAVDLATEHYRTSGDAPIVRRHGGIVFPFDESQPQVRCSPLRACDIELEAGEVIRDVALGDTERWIASPLASGDVDHSVPHVVVKPKDYGLSTNLVIGTTRRTYRLRLSSPTKAQLDSGHVTDHRHVSFYYPQQLVETWATEEELRRLEAERPKSTPHIQGLAAFSVDDLNFAYRIAPDRKIPWAPETVFDDGEHVYIQLPPAVRSRDLPALLVEIEGGDLAVSNYRVQGLWYIVDGLFERAQLVVGVGKARKKVALHNLRYSGS
ncbi:MAG: P-type conjugative transfer protein TrbG [bacterium]|nr:P-type conjugative transfer protein TrbG [bacterium]